MRNDHLSEYELIRQFISDVSSDEVRIVDTNHVVRMHYKEKEYNVLIRCVSYAGNPHPLHRFRAQLPKRDYLEQYRGEDDSFLFVGFDNTRGVYVCWNPWNVHPRLNLHSTVSLFCESQQLDDAIEKGIVKTTLPNGGKYIVVKKSQFKELLDNLNYFLGNENVVVPTFADDDGIIKHLFHQGLTVLEIIEFMMNSPKNHHPEWDYPTWHNYITTLKQPIEL